MNYFTLALGVVSTVINILCVASFIKDAPVEVHVGFFLNCFLCGIVVGECLDNLLSNE